MNGEVDTESKKNRISELISELSECREDERSTQNQILQVISVVGTILGILFGSSIFSSDKQHNVFDFGHDVTLNKIGVFNEILNKIECYVTLNRLLFWLSLLLFCASFAYITRLGIENILRHYYIQNIEDRLYELIRNTSDNEGRGDFLHWNAYLSPIKTRNTKHIASLHTALYYACYTISTGCIVLFSIGVIIGLYFKISPRKNSDHCLLIILILFIVITFILFFRLSKRAKLVMQFSWDTAHDNQKIRLNSPFEKTYIKAESFQRTMRYLLYPHYRNPQKPMLILLGVMCYILYSNVRLTITYLGQAFFVLLVFEFLIYQVRYQINDIRGILEDKKRTGRKGLIIDETVSEGHLIKISLYVIVLRIILAFSLIMFWGDIDRKMLCFATIFLFVSTIIYEFFRHRQKIWLVFISVGVGYALRFCVGFLTINPETYKDFLTPLGICFVIAISLFGSFAVVLSWTNEIIQHFNKEELSEISDKMHYNYLRRILDKHFSESNIIQRDSIKKELNLRKKGGLTAPWNLLYLISISLFGVCVLVTCNSWLIVSFEIVIFLLTILMIYVGYKNKKIIFMIIIIFSFFKMCISLNNPVLIFYIMQIIVNTTFFLLSYQPKLERFTPKKIINFILNVILGDYATQKLIEECYKMRRRNMNEKEI